MPAFPDGGVGVLNTGTIFRKMEHDGAETKNVKTKNVKNKTGLSMVGRNKKNDDVVNAYAQKDDNKDEQQD